MDSELVERIADLARSKKIQIAMSEWNINEAIWTAEKKVLKGKISSKEALSHQSSYGRHDQGWH